MALFLLGDALGGLGDLERRKSLQEESAALFHQLGDDFHEGEVLFNLGQVAQVKGDLDEARRIHEEALRLGHRAKSKRTIAYAHVHLGSVALAQRDYPIARSHLEAALPMYRQMVHKQRLLTCLENLLDLELTVGNNAAARVLLEEGLALAAEMSLENSLAWLRFSQGLLMLAEGDFAQAGSLIRGAAAWYTTAPTAGDSEAKQWFSGMAGEAAGLGDMVRAARLLGVAHRHEQASGTPIWPPSKVAYERAMAEARAQLGEEDFEKAMQEGRAMSMEQAVEYALQAR
jgi:tetratricopeptide (TPR) repeat protein